MNKVILAYSGGLDTSVAVSWLREQYEVEVVTLTVDLGGDSLRDNVAQRALKAGASRAYVVDGRDRFVRQFVWPNLQANALYQGVYPLATALARPLIAQLLVEVADRERGDAVAHGCTGKGNDQVRFDVAVHALDPKLEVVAPMRVGMGLSREEEMRLREYTESIIIKDVRSEERLLDEVSLFLHRVVGDMPAKKRQVIVNLHDSDTLFRNKSVLVVDDDMRSAFALAKLLSDRGMHVTKAEDGKKWWQKSLK